MRAIPFDEHGSVYDRALSRPIDFGVFPDDDAAGFYDDGILSVPRMFRMKRWWEPWGWAWLMLKSWAANRRSLERYSRMNAAERWMGVMGQEAGRTWRACFGPWVGSDWTRCSLHTAGRFFRHQLINYPSHYHRADRPGLAAAAGSEQRGLVRQDPELALFKPLVQEGPHVQISFRIAFTERVRFPRKHTAVAVADSEYNLTLFAQKQVWGPHEELGDGVQSLWAGTSCVGRVPAESLCCVSGEILPRPRGGRDRRDFQFSGLG